MKTMKILMAALLIGGCVTTAVYFAVRADRAIRTLTISVLRDLPKSFLVMESSEQLAVATINSGGWLLGPRIGQVVAKRSDGRKAGDDNPVHPFLLAREETRSALRLVRGHKTLARAAGDADFLRVISWPSRCNRRRP